MAQETEDNATSAQSPVTAPFGTWSSFKTFIEQDLKAKGIPNQIDRSLFKSKSGFDTRQLISALDFFRLVEGNVPNARLRALVAALGTPEWADTLKVLLREVYANILDGVDIENSTQKSLDDAFEAHGNVSGSTRQKAVRFYLSAAREANMKLSPHFITLRGVPEKTEPNGNANAAPRSARPRKSRSRGASMNSNEERITPPPGGVEVLQPIPGREFKIWLPSDFSPEEIDFSLTYLKNYLKLKGKAPK